tara:strand:+ start:622 stop:798 length:177 start_codon:yes stop_codon:yes gene_type:complete
MSELVEIFFGIIGVVVLLVVSVAVIGYRGLRWTNNKAKEQLRQMQLTKSFNKTKKEKE